MFNRLIEWRYRMNKELFEKVWNRCGGIVSGGVSLKEIEDAEKKLDVKFPLSYKEFLQNIGSGGVNGAAMFGLGNKNLYISVVEKTKEIRQKYGLKKEYIAITNIGTRWAKWIICLDTTRMYEEECPVVKFEINKREYREYKKNFNQLLNSDLNYVYYKSTAKLGNVMNRELPFGMGYKTCWMMIENASQLEIADVLLQGDKVEMEYKKGVDVVAHASFKDRKVLVTADYNNCNYIIGDAVHKIFHNYEKLRRELIDTVRTVVYATNRVSNIHAFAFFLHGNLKRMFYFSEKELINEGNIREEEEQLGLCLPISFDELHEHWNDGKFSDIDEELIVSLAKQQIGIDVEQYPYENVIIGELNLD